MAGALRGGAAAPVGDEPAALGDVEGEAHAGGRAQDLLYLGGLVFDLAVDEAERDEAGHEVLLVAAAVPGLLERGPVEASASVSTTSFSSGQ